MKFRNKILAVLLALLTATNSYGWNEEEKKKAGNKRKYIVAGLVVVGAVVTALGGRAVWKHFDLGKMFKKHVDRQKWVGIDLGTTKSGGGRGDELVPNEQGKTMTASAVVYDKDGNVVKVGDEALGEKGVVTSAKRIIGSPQRLVEQQNITNTQNETRKTFLPRTGARRPREYMAAITIDEGRSVSAERVAEDVLIDIKQRIETHHGEDFKNAVITVPAYFPDFKKAATKRAAQAAGFERVLLINEPTAAAFAHGAAELSTEQLRKGVNYLVYDFGGGTMDVSIVAAKLDENKMKTFTVKSIEGNDFLGGDDIDRKIAEKFAKDLKLGNFDELENAAQQKLTKHAESAKIHLSTKDAISYEGKLDNKTIKLSLKEFNEEIEDIVEETIDLTYDSIKNAKKIDIDDIDEVVLVGGSSRNLLVRDKLIDMFGEEKLARSLSEEIDPDEMVARGAAKYAQVLDSGLVDKKNGYKLADVVPISFRVDMVVDIVDDEEVLASIPVLEKLTPTGISGSKGGRAKTSGTDIIIRQGESTVPEENLLVGKLRLETTEEGSNVNVIYKMNNDGILEVTAQKIVGEKKPAEVKKMEIDMNITPEVTEVDKAAEQVAKRSEEVADEAAEQVAKPSGELNEALKQLAELLNPQRSHPEDAERFTNLAKLLNTPRLHPEDAERLTNMEKQLAEILKRLPAQE